LPTGTSPPSPPLEPRPRGAARRGRSRLAPFALAARLPGAAELACARAGAPEATVAGARLRLRDLPRVRFE
jgi:hypothetical protein